MTVESINGDVSGAVGPAVPGEASEESRVPDNRVREVWATIKRLTKSKFTRVFVSDDDDDDAWMLQYAVSSRTRTRCRSASCIRSASRRRRCPSPRRTSARRRSACGSRR